MNILLLKSGENYRDLLSEGMAPEKEGRGETREEASDIERLPGGQGQSSCR